MEFKTTPYAHQLDAFNLSKDRTSFALLMEMRTGKSKVVIDTAGWLFSQDKIDLLLVIAPNLVHRQWVDTEVPRHCPVAWSGTAWSSTWTPRKEAAALEQLEAPNHLAVFTINYEATISKRGKAALAALFKKYCVMLVIDESHRIKTPSAKQTKAILALGKWAAYRRILTGTPITQGPFDVWTQFNFLGSDILNCGSYFAFKNRYGIFETQYAHGRSYKSLVKYRNLEDLNTKTRAHSFRVTAKECLDLPDRQYTRIKFTMSREQQRVYDDLKTHLVAELNGETITAPLALTKLLRLQQITGGFFPFEYGDPQPIDYPNKRVAEVVEYAKSIEGKVIIWARFRCELGDLHRELWGDHYVGTGEHAVRSIHGGISVLDRANNLDAFQNDPEVKYLVANPAVAGEGLDLRVADSMIFYSCSFKLTERLQAEARCDAPGRTTPVTVIDVIADNTVDEQWQS